VTRTLVLAELRRRWLEYLLACIALTLVVTVLVTQRALTASAESVVHDLAHRLGKNMLVVPASTDLEAFHARRFGREALPDSIPKAIAASPLSQHVRGVELRLYGEVPVAGQKVLLVGDDGFPPGSANADAVPAVLGRIAAERLRLERGGTLQVAGRPLHVAEVLPAAPDGLDEAVFVPLPAAQRILGRPGEVSAARLAGCWCSIDVAALGKQIEQLLPGSRAITVAGMLAAQKGAVAEMKRWSGPISVAGAVLVAGLVAALVASQARRRTRELGLLVAIGAPPEKLAATFVLQAAALGAISGAAGWAIAHPISHALGERLVGAAVAPPSGLLWMSIALAAGVSAVAAAIPAFRAAAKDPTVVLGESLT
jgi:putative ABC transport system permease protein